MFLKYFSYKAKFNVWDFRCYSISNSHILCQTSSFQGNWSEIQKAGSQRGYFPPACSLTALKEVLSFFPSSTIRYCISRSFLFQQLNLCTAMSVSLAGSLAPRLTNINAHLLMSWSILFIASAALLRATSRFSKERHTGWISIDGEVRDTLYKRCKEVSVYRTPLRLRRVMPWDVRELFQFFNVIFII